MKKVKSHYKILFVCLGNICRSPTAECVLRNLFAQRYPAILVSFDSAGTAGYHIGKPADSRTRSAAAERGYRIDSIAKQFSPEMVSQYDLILAMDRENLLSIQSLFKTRPSNVRLFSEFLSDKWPQDVPDPYHGQRDGFEYVIDMIESATESLAEFLIKQNLESQDR